MFIYFFGLNFDIFFIAYSLMKDVAQYTRIGPSARVDRLQRYNRRLNTCVESVTILKEWNLKLDTNLVKIQDARELNMESIIFGGNKR